MGDKEGVAAAVLIMHRPRGNDTRIMILEGLSTLDRPPALGYFVLDAVVEAQRQDGHYPKMTLQIGLVNATRLSQEVHLQVACGPLDGRQSYGPAIYSPKLRGAEYGEVYRLTAAVERGDKGLLSS